MAENKNAKIPSPAELARRKRYLSATVITCIALVMVCGGMHVVGLGSMRMSEMRSLATYNLKEESSRIRAAGAVSHPSDGHSSARQDGTV